MKKILIFFLILNGSQVFCQTNFSVGFTDGYKIGYCYDQGVNCIAPIPPVTPICKVGESSHSYIDGYNRGLLVGTADKASKKGSNVFGNSTTGYVQPIYPKVERFEPDWALYEKTLQRNQSNYDKNVANSKTQKEQEEWEDIEKIAKEYMAPDKVSRRENYVKLLKQYYLDLKTYPTSIPDGKYEVTITTEPQFGQEMVKTTFSEGSAFVQDNKIVFYQTVSEFDGEDLYYNTIDSYPQIKDKDLGMGITESNSVLDGISKIRLQAFLNGKPFSKGEIKKVYFIDYIIKYQNAQECIKEIKTTYNALTKYPKVQDGWNIVSANDGEGQCEIRKVFVEKGKVTQYKNGVGTDFQITSGGFIQNNKTTISYVSTSKDKSKSKTLIIELYFM